jgi:hypothetical protein
MKLPRAIRFFRKPDHISFLVGFILILIHLVFNNIEIKIATIIFFTFTLIYETYEISKGNRDIIKLDHIAFVIGYVLLILTLWYELWPFLVISSILFSFTLGWEIYSVRKRDLENMKRDLENDRKK